MKCAHQGFNSARSIVGITIYESAVTISNPNPVGVFMKQVYRYSPRSNRVSTHINYLGPAQLILSWSLCSIQHLRKICLENEMSCINPKGVSLVGRIPMSTGERPFIDIVQDRRYWVFVAGVIFLHSPFIYKLFGRILNLYFYLAPNMSNLSLINDRFSSLDEMSDI